MMRLIDRETVCDGRLSGENFAGRLAALLAADACLTDAATGCRSSRLGEAIAQAAGAFAAAGLKPGDRVAISCDLSPATALAILGAVHLGAVAVPVDRSRLAEAIAGTAAAACWLPAASVLDVAIPVLTGLEALAGPAVACARRGDDDLALLMATSGSTGAPRFVRVSHGNLAANTAAIAASQKLGLGDRALLVLPLSYCFGLSVLFSHLWAGGGIVFEPRMMFPETVLDSIRIHDCTSFVGVPTVYRLLLSRSQIAQRPLPGLKRLLQAGGPLDAAAIDALRAAQPQADFYVMYGQTEATARITTLDPADFDRKRGSVGRPLPGLELRLLPGPDIAEGSGEVLVRGPSVTAGYWNPADPAPFHEGWLRTGDIGRIDEDGFLWIEGRLSDFIKVRGLRVSVGEVEARLTAIAGIRCAACAGMPHAESGEALAIAVQLDADISQTDIAVRIKRLLPSQWTIGGIAFVEALPLTPNGKIARQAIPGLLDMNR